MPLYKVIILAIVQGLAELLPVSSSAHVIVAAKLMHEDPTSQVFTFLLVLLHTGTMFAVIVYFWKRWAMTYFRSAASFQATFVRVAVATVLTGVVGYPIKKIIEKTMFAGAGKAEIENLFGRLDLVAIALFCAGCLILAAGLARRSKVAGPAMNRRKDDAPDGGGGLSVAQAGLIGGVQGLSLPFRGFSRSGTTISAGMLGGVEREAAETFSFAIAVVLTPIAVGYEALRLVKAIHHPLPGAVAPDLHGSLVTGLLGMVFSFFAGLVGLKWLSSWLESGRWYLFGIYCILFSAVVFYLHTKGY